MVAGMDARLTTHNNQVTTLEADMESKENVLQERDERLRFQGVELKEKDDEIAYLQASVGKLKKTNGKLNGLGNFASI